MMENEMEIGEERSWRIKRNEKRRRKRKEL